MKLMKTDRSMLYTLLLCTESYIHRQQSISSSRAPCLVLFTSIKEQKVSV